LSYDREDQPPPPPPHHVVGGITGGVIMTRCAVIVANEKYPRVVAL